MEHQCVEQWCFHYFVAILKCLARFEAFDWFLTYFGVSRISVRYQTSTSHKLCTTKKLCVDDIMHRLIYKISLS
jgi:hypothetical protein